MKRTLPLVMLLLAGGCATERPAPPPHAFDFAKIRRISIPPFEGAGGKAVTDECVRQLLGTGLEVTDAHHPGDVMLKGAVTDYKTDVQLTVFLGNTSIATSQGQAVTVDNPVVFPGGLPFSREESALVTPNAQVITLVASVGVAAQLVDTSTGKTVWAGSASYESLDIQDALHASVGMLTQSLKKVLPQMK